MSGQHPHLWEILVERYAERAFNLSPAARPRPPPPPVCGVVRWWTHSESDVCRKNRSPPVRDGVWRQDEILLDRIAVKRSLWIKKSCDGEDLPRLYIRCTSEFGASGTGLNNPLNDAKSMIRSHPIFLLLVFENTTK